MIVIIDYKVGNVKSVCNAFSHIGCEALLSNKAETIKHATGLVLPGVAAFGYALKALGGNAQLVKQAASQGKPILGICVGYQLLFRESTERGLHKGLALISGRVVPVPAGRTVPHMGWNRVELPEDMELFARLGGERYFYFAHSFYARISDQKAKIAYTDYGCRLTAAVQKENIYGVQFHPEKSGNAGLQVLRNFSRICEKENH